MKLLQFQKPISSPGRVDNKFPPPLLRFLRSNGGSRSRGRFRSSPIFIRKKNETNGGTETQEPTSPEVTCMGQVRVTRSSSKHIKKKTSWKSKSKKTKKKSRCWWVRRAWNRPNWKSNKKVRDFQLFWWRWVSCFQFGFQGKVEIEEKTGEAKREETEEEEKREAKVFAAASSSSSSSSTPPKNALLLMRCRSEPYRASSLANRFWGSPSNEEETEQQQHETEHEKKNREEEEEEEEEEKPTLKKETSCRDSAIEPRKPSEIEEKFGFCQGLESSSSSTNKDETLNKTRNGGGLCNSSSSSRPPLILTRCKSEPARRTEKFDPDTCFWKTRLGFVDICTTRI